MLMAKLVWLVARAAKQDVMSFTVEFSEERMGKGRTGCRSWMEDRWE